MRSKRGLTKPASTVTTPFGSGSAAAIRPSRSKDSVVSKLLSTEPRNTLESRPKPTAKATTVQTTATAIRRAARESNLGAIFSVRVFEAIAKSTHRLNQVGVQLAA